MRQTKSRARRSSRTSCSGRSARESRSVMPGDLEARPGRPEPHLEIAQAALRLLEVGLEQVERVAELLAPLPRLPGLVGDEGVHLGLGEAVELVALQLLVERPVAVEVAQVEQRRAGGVVGRRPARRRRGCRGCRSRPRAAGPRGRRGTSRWPPSRRGRARASRGGRGGRGRCRGRARGARIRRGPRGRPGVARVARGGRVARDCSQMAATIRSMAALRSRTTVWPLPPATVDPLHVPAQGREVGAHVAGERRHRLEAGLELVGGGLGELGEGGVLDQHVACL